MDHQNQLTGVVAVDTSAKAGQRSLRSQPPPRYSKAAVNSLRSPKLLRQGRTTPFNARHYPLITMARKGTFNTDQKFSNTVISTWDDFFRKGCVAATFKIVGSTSSMKDALATITIHYPHFTSHLIQAVPGKSQANRWTALGLRELCPHPQIVQWVVLISLYEFWYPQMPSPWLEDLRGWKSHPVCISSFRLCLGDALMRISM